MDVKNMRCTTGSNCLHYPVTREDYVHPPSLQASSTHANTSNTSNILILEVGQYVGSIDIAVLATVVLTS
uniref:Uncharacterized protein n=1 Tax=Timema tahoe TaxID=61484 RepID=A0A7R9IHC8_9NEOP|nr:unnamed protein product [Timema tahoe]